MLSKKGVEGHTLFAGFVVVSAIILLISSQFVTANDDLEDLISQSVPTGTILTYSGTSAPMGFLLADGDIVLDVDYPELCGILDDTYGVGNSTHCQLPDLRQRFQVGKSDSGVASTLGETGGQFNYTFEIDPPSQDTSNDGSHNHFVDIPQFNSGASGSQTVGIVGLLSTASPPNHIHTVNPPNTASTTNGTHDHDVDIAPFNETITDVIPKYITLNYIIKT